MTHLYTLPLLVPVPCSDGHTVTAGETSNIVRVRLERRNFLVCVAVEDTQLEVVRTDHEPVLASRHL